MMELLIMMDYIEDLRMLIMILIYKFCYGGENA